VSDLTDSHSLFSHCQKKETYALHARVAKVFAIGDSMYEDVIQFLNRVENPKKKSMNNRTKFSAKQIQDLRKKHPGCSAGVSALY